uniref:Uncharacterized protein n=1 Tax=Arundo donax TaxID=35708 RepID=A0A0A9BBH0_ARUDO
MLPTDKDLLCFYHEPEFSSWFDPAPLAV